MHELTYYGMGRGTAGAGAGLTMEVGGRVRLAADMGNAGSWNGPRDTHVSVTSETDREGRAFLSSAPLKLAGTYGPEAGDGRPVVAVNVEAREADIRHVLPAQMAAALGADAKDIVERPAMLEMASAASVQSGGSVIGPWLVGAALLLFALESVLALAFSTYR